MRINLDEVGLKSYLHLRLIAYLFFCLLGLAFMVGAHYLGIFVLRTLLAIVLGLVFILYVRLLGRILLLFATSIFI